MADTASSDSSTPSVEKGWPALKQQIIKDKITVAQWVIRLMTMFFSLAYVIPVFGNPYDSYYKVLLCCSVINVLRLHQRLPRIQFSSEFFYSLLSEDSFHYLFFSFIFQYTSPITLAIMPIFLFALLHSSSYSLTLLDCLGRNSWWGARLLISLIEFQSRNILRMCSYCEILLMPMTVILVFSGKAGLITPLVYYQFLDRRLSSRRNPYTRNVFIEITNTLNFYASKPRLPGMLRSVMNYAVSVMRRMTPVHQ